MKYLAANTDRSAALSRTGIAATLLLCLSCLLAGCDTTPSKDNQSSEALTAVQENSTGAAEEFLIVDCLLPGQVRQLGGNFNYLTQRRPIKTSQSDCEIRGGEYVAYDRADYSTALKIWLPLAKAGDANAQTYVGEIYEKGLGLQADYTLAAHWYGEAVKQGYSRAQINLGNLYEKGLGVTQDKERALNLYRSASGLGADHLLYASTLSTNYVPVQEYQSVQQELASEQRRSSQLRASLASVSNDLERESAALGAAEKELLASRSKLEAAVAGGAEVSASSAATGSAEEQQLLASVLTMEAQQNDLESQLDLLRQQNGELATSQQALVEQLSSHERARNEQQARVNELEQELAETRSRVSRSEQELAGATQKLAQEQPPSPELARLQTELEASNQALNEERIKQARLTSEREALAEQLASTDAQVAGYESRIEQMARQMALEQQRIEQSEAEVAALRSELAQQGTSAAEQQPQILALQRSVDLKNEALSEQRRLYQLLADEKTAIEQQVAASDRLKSGYESQVAELKAELATSNSALQSSRSEAEALASRLAENEASNSAMTPEILALRRDLQAKSEALAEEQVRLASLESQSQSRQQQLDSSQSALEQTSQQLASVERQYAKEKANLESLLYQRERELDDIEHQLLLSRANMQMERNAGEEALAAQASSHEQALNAQRSELEQLTSQVVSQYDQVQSQKAEIARLQQQATNYQDELASGDISPARAPTPQVAALTADGPAIEIIEPPVVLTRSQATVRLRTFRGERQVIGKVSAPSGLLSLSVNGETPTLTSNNLFRASVPLTEDPTPVEVVLVDNEGRRAAVSFSFIDQEESGGSSSAPIIAKTSFDNSGRFYDVPMGDYHALIIGNNEYRNFSTLATAVNDARETDKVLREKYGFETKLLLNADRYTILAALNELRETLDADDNLLIYYAGHGKLDESNELGYWLPVDADQDNNINWISNKSITDILNVIEAKHILVVADSCYAGTLTQTPIARAQLDIPDDVREEWIKVMTETRARITLTSGGVEPVLDGGGGRHSVFAKAFLDALRDNSGVLEGYSLYSRVLEVMAAVDSPLGSAQIPQYAPIHLAGHESGEFFFNPG